MSDYRWLHLYPDEFHDRRSACPVAYLPMGPAEPHGDCAKMGVDLFIAEGLCAYAAQKVGGIVAPSLAWHIGDSDYSSFEREIGGMTFPISTVIPAELFLQQVLFCIRDFDARRFSACALLSGHMVSGLNQDMRLLADFYCRKTHSPMRVFAGYAVDFTPSDARECIEIDHAGFYELGMVMALDESGVDFSKDGQKLNIPADWAGGSVHRGRFCAPVGYPQNQPTTLEDGQRMLSTQGEAFCSVVGDLLTNAPENTGQHAPSLSATMGLWAEFLTITRRYWGCTPTVAERKNGTMPPPFPGWDALGVRFD